MSVLPECAYVYNVHVWCQQRSEEGISFPQLELQMIMSLHVSSRN